jgi:exodeoxyribonuclease VII small subunit
MSRTRKAPPESGRTYEEAVAELEALLDRIESGDTGLDDLVQLVETAAERITECRSLLAGSRARIDMALRRLESGEGDPPSTTAGVRSDEDRDDGDDDALF